MTAEPPTIADVMAKLDAIAARLDQPAARFMSVDSAAQYCDLSPASIRRCIARGDLQPHRAVRGRILLDRLEIDELVLGSAGRKLRNGRGQKHG